MKRFRIVSFTVMAGGVILLSACVTTPSGPGVMALPGTGKSFDQFRYDDATCRDYALALVGGRGSDQAATDAGLKSAAVGTVVGAVAGAAMGGHESAGAGAGAGLIVGSMAGAGAAQESSYGAQRRYDFGYVQCMYAKGHRVPVSGDFIGGEPSSPAVLSRPSIPPPPR